MAFNSVGRREQTSIPKGIVLGACRSLFLAMLASGCLAAFVNMEWLAEEDLGYGVMALHLLASWMGGVAAWRKTRQNKMLVCMGAALTYYGILLLITAVVFAGEYSGTGVTGLLILGGSAAALLSDAGNKRLKIRPKIKIPNR